MLMWRKIQSYAHFQRTRPQNTQTQNEEILHKTLHTQKKKSFKRVVTFSGRSKKIAQKQMLQKVRFFQKKRR